METFLRETADMIWGWPMMIILMGTHLFLTLRLKFPQRHLFKAIKLSVTPEEGSDGDISPFAALATALAANVGTGNIIGMGTAVALGGPGAVFWCWFSGILGIATKYSEGLLAVKYRVKTPDGKMLGGPMYALERGLGWKLMGVLFAFFTIFNVYLGGGSTIQANTISMILKETYNISPSMVAWILTFLTGIIVMGGVKSIARVCTLLVPFMVVAYMICSAILLFFNAEYILPAVGLIVKSAFAPKAVGGGLLGGSMMIAARYGIARGLFSNESGQGTIPIIAAAAKTRNPVRQALICSSGTFWDTVILCAMTGIVIVSALMGHPEMVSQNGGVVVKTIFAQIPCIGEHILAFCLTTFAFSTIIGFSYFGESAVKYIGMNSFLKFIPMKYLIFLYRILYLGTVFMGSVISLNMVWNIGEISNALMALPNLLSLVFLSGVVVSETKRYLWDNRLDDTMEE